jgi:hypothetical protein
MWVSVPNLAERLIPVDSLLRLLMQREVSISPTAEELTIERIKLPQVC